MIPFTVTIEGRAESIEQIRERILNSFQDDARFGMDNIDKATLAIFDERKQRQIYIENFPNESSGLGTETSSTDRIDPISG